MLDFEDYCRRDSYCYLRFEMPFLRWEAVSRGPNLWSASDTEALHGLCLGSHLTTEAPH